MQEHLKHQEDLKPDVIDEELAARLPQASGSKSISVNPDLVMPQDGESVVLRGRRPTATMSPVVDEAVKTGETHAPAIPNWLITTGIVTGAAAGALTAYLWAYNNNILGFADFVNANTPRPGGGGAEPTAEVAENPPAAATATLQQTPGEQSTVVVTPEASATPVEAGPVIPERMEIALGCPRGVEDFQQIPGEEYVPGIINYLREVVEPFAANSEQIEASIVQSFGTRLNIHGRAGIRPVACIQFENQSRNRVEPAIIFALNQNDGSIGFVVVNINISPTISPQDFLDLALSQSNYYVMLNEEAATGDLLREFELSGRVPAALQGRVMDGGPVRTNQ